MRLALSSEQVEKLLTLASTRQHELLLEIARADVRAYRSELQREYDELERLAGQLRHGRDYANAERELPVI